MEYGLIAGVNSLINPFISAPLPVEKIAAHCAIVYHGISSIDGVAIHGDINRYFAKEVIVFVPYDTIWRIGVPLAFDNVAFVRCNG